MLCSIAMLCLLHNKASATESAAAAKAFAAIDKQQWCEAAHHFEMAYRDENNPKYLLNAARAYLRNSDLTHARQSLEHVRPWISDAKQLDVLHQLDADLAAAGTVHPALCLEGVDTINPVPVALGVATTGAGLLLLASGIATTVYANDAAAKPVHNDLITDSSQASLADQRLSAAGGDAARIMSISGAVLIAVGATTVFLAWLLDAPAVVTE